MWSVDNDFLLISRNFHAMPKERKTLSNTLIKEQTWLLLSIASCYFELSMVLLVFS